MRHAICLSSYEEWFVSIAMHFHSNHRLKDHVIDADSTVSIDSEPNLPSDRQPRLLIDTNSAVLLGDAQPNLPSETTKNCIVINASYAPLPDALVNLICHPNADGTLATNSAALSSQMNIPLWP